MISYKDQRNCKKLTDFNKVITKDLEIDELRTQDFGCVLPKYDTKVRDNPTTKVNIPYSFFIKVIDNHCKSGFVPILLTDSIKKLKKAQRIYNLSSIYILKDDYYIGVCLKVVSLKRYLKILKGVKALNYNFVQKWGFFPLQVTEKSKTDSNFQWLRPYKTLNRNSEGAFSLEFFKILTYLGFVVNEKPNINYKLSMKTIEKGVKQRKWKKRGDEDG